MEGKAGRPEGTYKFTPEQIQDAWQEYRGKCDANTREEVSAGKVVTVKRPKVYTLQTFQVFLGISREAWGDYRTYPDYSDTIRAIEAEVLARKAEALVNAEGSTAGLQFDLKANHGWTDKQVIESKVEITSVEVQVVPAVGSAEISTSEKDVDIDK